MGYTTEFEGIVKVEPPFTGEQVAEINNFSHEDHRNNITFPGYYCQWIASKEGVYWDGGEKFYNSLEWMQYLIDRWVKPDRIANGTIDCYGEQTTDIWRIVVRNNEATRIEPSIVWPIEVAIEYPEDTIYKKIDEITLENW